MDLPGVGCCDRVVRDIRLCFGALQLADRGGDFVKNGNRPAEDLPMRREQSGSILPPNLDGTLLLRGRSRIVVTAVLPVIYVIVGYRVLDDLGDSTNTVIVPAALLLAWMWGSAVGVVAALIGVSISSYVAGATGVAEAVGTARIVEAVIISIMAFVIGYIGRVLEKALGARDRADRTISQLEASARDRMLTITDQVPVGLYRTTPDGAIIGGNEALMRMLGFEDREAMLRTNVWDHYVRSEDRQQQIEAAGKADAAWREYQLRRSDGDVIWVRDWSVAVPDECGGVLHFDGVLEDITERRIADARFEAAFEDAPIGMAIASSDGRIVKANKAVAELLGVPAERLVGMHFSAYSIREDLETTRAALSRLEAGEGFRYEKRIKRADGSFVWALISLAPIDVGDDTTTRFISHVVDVTDRRKARDALEELVRSKDELIASVSHELRTPLTVVHGLAQELDTGLARFSVLEQKEFISLIAQQSAEVAHIVEDLLVAAQADIGKLPVHSDTVDLRGQLESAISAGGDVAIAVETNDGADSVAFADGTRVRQIVRNLLSNAQRYGGPHIEMRCGVAGAIAWLEVADDGDGIPDEDAAAIFEPYQRSHNAVGQPSSVGLGLTVSRKLAELMGGRLTYRYESGWSIFRLDLPAAGSMHAIGAGSIRSG